MPDTADAGQWIDDVDGGVVVEEQRIVRVFWRIDVDDLEQRRRFLADRKSAALDFLRKKRRGELSAVLDVDRVDVRVGAEREGDGQ